MAEIERFDEHLSFSLTGGIEIEHGINDDGDPIFRVVYGRKVDNDGDISYNFSTLVYFDESVDFEDLDFIDGYPFFVLKGNRECRICEPVVEKTLYTMKTNVCLILAYIKSENGIYVLQTVKVGQTPFDFTEDSSFLQKVFSGVTIDGAPCCFENITADILSSNAYMLDDYKQKKGLFPFPAATPDNEKHTFLDTSNRAGMMGMAFGGLFQVGSSVLCLRQISELIFENSAAKRMVFERAVNFDNPNFILSDIAGKMSAVFRVDIQSFDSRHDREQEIREGNVCEAEFIHSFRSFAWTLGAYCNQESISPADVPFETLEKMAEFIDSRGSMNYKESSFCPAICTGDDIHVYYVPDALSDEDRAILCGSPSDEEQWEVQSLDKLRNDLNFLFPAMKTIFEKLLQDRDTSVELAGGVADYLYVWCVFTLAASQPFCTDEQAMAGFFRHPDEQENWQLQMRISNLQQAINNGNAWLDKYKSKMNLGERITINGKFFVFTGIESRDNWLDILEKLTAEGGTHRSAVSGKTDYLVCEPAYAGDSLVKKALEQRIKGKPVKIVLFSDFMKALGMEYVSPEQELANLRGQDCPDDDSGFSPNLIEGTVNEPAQICEEAPKADERPSKQQLQRDFEKEHMKWEEACDKVTEKRNNEVADKMQSFSEQQNEEKRLRKQLDELEVSCTSLAERIKQNESELASLGVFQFAAKKEKKALIASLTADKEKAEASVSQLKEKCNKAKSLYKERENKMRLQYQKEAEEHFPMPEEPEPPC